MTDPPRRLSRANLSFGIILSPATLLPPELLFNNREPETTQGEREAFEGAFSKGLWKLCQTHGCAPSVLNSHSNSYSLDLARLG